MNKARYKPIHNRKGKLNSKGEALVQIEAYFTGKRKYISTGIYVTPNQWDNKQWVINHPNHEKSNNRLIKLLKINLKAVKKR